MRDWNGFANGLESAALALVRRAYAAGMQGEFREPTAPLNPPSQPCTLYLHVPFCESLCPFCSFHRVAYRAPKAELYFQALREEIRHYHRRGFEFNEVYVGGGTPTVAPAELDTTLRLVRSLWPIRRLSVETNPNHLIPETMAQLQCCGVDRLSVGVQSFDDVLLQEMGRLQPYGTAADIPRRLEGARGRFRTLNVDLMFNFPHQSIASLQHDLATVRDLGVDQVSYYPLMNADETRRRMRKAMGEVEPARRREYYRAIREGLQPQYQPSSAWCFTQQSAKHPSAALDEYIIDSGEYVGAGSGAFSYLGGTLYATTFSLNAYRERVGSGRSAITACRALTPRQRLHYDLLVGLFGLSMPWAALERKHGTGVRRALAPELAALRLLGAIRAEGDTLQLTERGMYYWMLMMAEFFTAVNELRATMRRHIRAEPVAAPAGLNEVQRVPWDPDRSRTGRLSRDPS